MNNPATLTFNPQSLPRELKKYYISASKKDIQEMLNSIGKETLESLFNKLPNDMLFETSPNLPEELSYENLQKNIYDISQKNNSRISFIGDALPAYKVNEIVPFVSNIRNLTTSYTPYQPERSQGTLISLWIYQCLISSLTGFEAINASLYDRATALFEAISCALRLSKECDTVLVSEGIFPQDMKVIKSLSQNTSIKIRTIALDPQTGLISLRKLQDCIKQIRPKLAAFAYPQVNQLGLIEDVDTLTDVAHKTGLKCIAIIDPMLIAKDGLKSPAEYGKKGADFLVGEGQHLAIAPNFGGPGLGIFGVRYNVNNKIDIRTTPGRYVGKTKDIKGDEAFTMVLSTREQHIRKEKATSNICSNQAFLATLAGASILSRGKKQMSECCLSGFHKARNFIKQILHNTNVKLAFPQTPFFNECILELPEPSSIAIKKGINANLHIGIDMSERISPTSKNLLKISFSDIQNDEDCKKLTDFFESNYITKIKNTSYIPEIPSSAWRKLEFHIPTLSIEEIKSYYQKLGELNVSPDDAPYPLGSCTMKYNPYINDWAANLHGFTEIHPQAPLEDIQGSLEILFHIQEWFRKITGLAAVTTQPVAGAQGELISLKLFMAYHKNNGDANRTKIFIPKSAHGTNFASAAIAGISLKNIIQLQSTPEGHIDIADLDSKINEFKTEIIGIMITNPNTGGLFEMDFKSIANKIHDAGGLVFMDGANLNAIAGWVDLKKLGVDAMHSNLHKTWSIPHGGGGPGDAIVAVSEKLAPFLPGCQITKDKNGLYVPKETSKSIGTFHRHWGNFAHKVRCYTYLRRLGNKGIREMSAVAVLSAQYLFHILKSHTPTLPIGSENTPRMHEFIITLNHENFKKLESIGISKTHAIACIGKLFLDFGYHSPTIAFPEPLGLMIEPTESYTKQELDRLAETIIAIFNIIDQCPEYLLKAPLSTPVGLIDEVTANRVPILNEHLTRLPKIPQTKIPQTIVQKTPIQDIFKHITSPLSHA